MKNRDMAQIVFWGPLAAFGGYGLYLYGEQHGWVEVVVRLGMCVAGAIWATALFVLVEGIDKDGGG